MICRFPTLSIRTGFFPREAAKTQPADGEPTLARLGFLSM